MKNTSNTYEWIVGILFILVFVAFFGGAYIQAIHPEKLLGNPCYLSNKIVCEQPEDWNPQQPNGLQYSASLSGGNILILNKNIFLDYIGGNRTEHTYSMSPVINDGDIAIFTQDYNEADLRVGNIVRVYRDNFKYPMVHRIIHVRQNSDGNICYDTKGDNNTRPDYDLGCITSEDIEGLYLGVLWK